MAEGTGRHNQIPGRLRQCLHLFLCEVDVVHVKWWAATAGDTVVNTVGLHMTIQCSHIDTNITPAMPDLRIEERTPLHCFIHQQQAHSARSSGKHDNTAGSNDAGVCTTLEGTTTDDMVRRCVAMLSTSMTGQRGEQLQPGLTAAACSGRRPCSRPPAWPAGKHGLFVSAAVR